jgi:hypothetical protein
MTSLTSASLLSTAELANLIGQLHAGRNPSWREQTSSTDSPSTAADGIALTQGADGGAISTLFQLRVRKVAAYRQAIFQIGEDNVQTYTIACDVGGGAVAFAAVSDGTATKQEIADELLVQFNLSALTTQLDAFSEEDPVTGDYRFRLAGKTTFSFDWSVTTVTATGAGTLVCTADPSFCRFLAWGFPGGDREDDTESLDVNQAQPFVGGAAAGTELTSPWLSVDIIPEPAAVPHTGPAGEQYAYFYGVMDRLATAGMTRVYIQTMDITGPTLDAVGVLYSAPRVIIGGGRREDARPSATS